ncbi:MAG: hypothetical protein KME50_22640 [Nostoc desertorum CM1-VF14]|nr:hypothetical protein [Nostoc desertorum CM1-VF14]
MRINSNLFKYICVCKHAITQNYLHQCSRAEAEATGVFGNQGSDRKLHWWVGAVTRRKGYPAGLFRR